jgi:hypothetical protein
VRYVDDTAISEDTLFGRNIKRRARAKELFQIVDDIMKEKGIKWVDCVEVSTAVARVMAGNKRLQALIKLSAQ